LELDVWWSSRRQRSRGTCSMRAFGSELGLMLLSRAWLRWVKRAPIRLGPTLRSSSARRHRERMATQYTCTQGRRSPTSLAWAPCRVAQVPERSRSTARIIRPSRAQPSLAMAPPLYRVLRETRSPLSFLAKQVTGAEYRARTFLGTAFAAAIALCCSNDCPDNSRACSSCPQTATTCSANCDSVTGSSIDPQRRCRKSYEVIACRPHQDEVSASATCYVRVADGVAFIVPGGEFTGPAWRGCRADERDTFVANFCPDANP
jgi:hypothetical protein